MVTKSLLPTPEGAYVFPLAEPLMNREEKTMEFTINFVINHQLKGKRIKTN